MLSPQSRRLSKEEEEEEITPPQRKSPMDNPEWAAACEAYRDAVSEYNRKMEAWWATLDDEQQQWAFYNVCRRIYKGDVQEKRSYRGVLYDIFGWGPESYVIGMEARYMEIHNLLWDAVRFMEKGTRLD